MLRNKGQMASAFALTGFVLAAGAMSSVGTASKVESAQDGIYIQGHLVNRDDRVLRNQPAKLCVFLNYAKSENLAFREQEKKENFLKVTLEKNIQSDSEGVFRLKAKLRTAERSEWETRGWLTKDVTVAAVLENDSCRSKRLLTSRVDGTSRCDFKRGCRFKGRTTTLYHGA